jgi:alginate O-acetyltransferase complex protein AlgF
MTACYRLCALFSLLVSGSLQAAEIPLYPTGPDEDSAFLRFFNAGSGPLELVAAGSGTRLSVDDQQRVSDFLSVPAGKAVKGTLSQGARSQALDIQVEPGEFATVVGINGAEGLQLRVVREQPDDFNALKASLAFYSLDASCEEAGLQAAGRNLDIFKAVADGEVQRRSINPLKLSVQLTCAGAAQGAPLELGELQAGERYTVFLIPSAQGPQLIGTTDKLAF